MISFLRSSILPLSALLVLNFVQPGCKNKPTPPNNDPSSKTTLPPVKQSLESEPIPPGKNEKPVKASVSEATPMLTDDPNEKNSNVPKNLVVSFYSIGGGIDGAFFRKYDGFIAGYRASGSKPISFEKVPWGREGEVDFCIDPTNLMQPEYESFLRETKDILQGCKMVHVKPDGECHRRR